MELRDLPRDEGSTGSPQHPDRNFLDLYFDADPSSVFLANPKGQLVYWNPSFKNLVGATGYDVDLDLQRYFSAGDLVSKWTEELQEEKPPLRFETEIVNLAGLRRKVVGTVRGQFWEGELASVLGFLADVSDRSELIEQLIQSQKSNLIGQLAGGVAHDFNNLLTVISGASEFLGRELGARYDLTERVKIIQQAAAKGMNLSQQLLAFGRSQLGQPEVLNLNNIVFGLSDLLERLLGENVALEFRLADDLGCVEADASQVEQILINLVFNGRDAMLDGGHLELRTENVELPENFSQDGVEVKAGSYVALAVSDSGSGMGPSTRDQIFEPFFTTKDSGTGLGLSTVQRLVRQADGYISVSSQLGEGSMFRILLPRLESANGLAGDEQEAKMQIPDSGGHDGTCILVVEDVTGLRDVIKDVLELNGYQVLLAKDGHQAIECSSSFGGEIDLLLTDVVMPGLGGAEASAAITSQRPGLKVLYMSGYADSTILDQGVLPPGTAFLQKPFTPNELVAKIQSVLATSDASKLRTEPQTS